MKTIPVIHRALILLLSLLMVLTAATACQSSEEATATPTVPAPTQPVAQIVATVTAVPAVPTQPQPTVTSPVPTPLASAVPPVAPTAVPEPTFYTIAPGDSLLGIAEIYNVSVDFLVVANGYASVDEFFIIAGTEIQIPLCQAHHVLSGNTLAGISQLCGLTLDDLVTHNIASLAPLGSLDNVPVGFVLIFPSESSSPEDLNCNIQPEREQVIQYTPLPGEGVFCLSQKFNISTTTIIQANIQRLTGDNVYGTVALLIPPNNGILYVVTAEDVDNGVKVAQIAEWYVVPPESVTDWNGNPVSDPLVKGQQLFITGADQIVGQFQSQAPEAVEPGGDDSG
jgi:LysM repeat protein